MDTLTLKTHPQLHSLPIDTPEDLLPVNVLIDPNNITLRPLPRDQLLFCYQALLNTIDSLRALRYTDFDGHTTANCCHGMALLSWHLIPMAQALDLPTLRHEYEQIIHRISQEPNPHIPEPTTGLAPKVLVNLASLYILCFVKESDPSKGGRTITKKLKQLASISIHVCDQISHNLQKFFASWIANNYVFYLERLDKALQINGAPAQLWGKYIGHNFIRSDKRGVKYASNLFSMQITLGYLSQTKAKVALINDAWDPHSDCVTDRYTCLFEGDGLGGFTPISKEQLNDLQPSFQEEPVFIAGGCIYPLEIMDKEALSSKMLPWKNNFTQLVFSGDVFYPQFPHITDDPEFDNTPIVPHEISLQQLITAYTKTRGVSNLDPSLYCRTHLYTSSLTQFRALNTSCQTALPLSFIPKSKRIFSTC